MPDRNSMHPLKYVATRQTDGAYNPARKSRRGFHGLRAFTLAETMVASTIFFMGMLGVYTMMIYSYKMESLARYRDNARSVLLTYADRFERLQTTDPATGYLRNFFDTVPSTPNSLGLSWTDNSGNFTDYSTNSATITQSWTDKTGATTSGSVTGFQILIGDSTSAQIPAVITEIVRNCDANGVSRPTTGAGSNAAAGRIVEATFTITYTIPGVPQKQNLSLTVTRTVP